MYGFDVRYRGRLPGLPALATLYSREQTVCIAQRRFMFRLLIYEFTGQLFRDNILEEHLLASVL